MTHIDCDVLIRAGFVSSMKDGDAAVLQDQFIAIQGEKILGTGPWTQNNYKGTRFIDAQNSWVVPGLINAHTHLPMTLLRGMADDLPLKDWLEKAIFPTEGRLVDPEFCRLGTEIALIEAALSGSTTFCDMYYFEDSIAEVVERSGLRAFLGETIIDFPAPDNKQKDGADYRLLDKLNERYKNHARIQPVIAPHAPYTCSDATLKGVRDYAEKNGNLISIHVSETAFEQSESLKNFGKTPTQRLYDLGLMQHKSVFAHCVHLSDSDIDLLIQTNTAAIYNPESNMKLGSGAAPIVKMLKKGAMVALGTDGCASNNDLNMLREMDTGAKLQKLVSNDNSAIGAFDMLKLATRGGAKALGLENSCGQLAPGFLADITIIGTRHAHLQPLHDVPSLIYALQGNEVEHVFCHGKHIVENGKMLSIDQNRVLDELAFYRKKVSL